MKINSENIDELMFQLLEGDIQGEERTRLLEAIAADKEYSKLWQAWQQTVLNPNDELIVMPIAPLLKKKKVVVWSWKYGVAAMLCIAVGASIFYIGDKSSTHLVESTVKPKNPKLEIIKVPTNEPVSKHLKELDTVISFKQKIESIASSNKIAKPNKSIEVMPTNLPQVDFVESKQPKINEQLPTKEVFVTPKVSVPATVISEPVDNDYSGILVSIDSESKQRSKETVIKNLVNEKKNFISRLFSKPNFKIVNDSNNLRDSKIVIENKKYRIIAGF